jgi:hypothetical protein
MLCAHLKQRCATTEEDSGDKRRRVGEDGEEWGMRGTWGQKRKRGTDDVEEARGLETLHTGMVERFVGLEMTLIHRLEVQDRKLEKVVVELMGEAQRLHVQGERIIALLEAEALSEDEEADVEGEDDQAVVAVVTGNKGEGEDEDEDGEDAEETEETLH